MAAPRLAPWIGVVAALCLCATTGYGDEARAVARFQDDIQPLLIDYCYRCHADGTSKGGVAFDAGGSDEATGEAARPLVVGAQERPRGDHAAGRQAATDRQGDRGPGRLDQARRLRRRSQGSRSGPGDDPSAQPGRVPQHDPRPDGDRLQGGGGIPARRHGLRLRQHRRRAQRLAAAPGEVLPGGREHREDRRADRLEAHARAELPGRRVPRFGEGPEWRPTDLLQGRDGLAVIRRRVTPETIG